MRTARAVLSSFLADECPFLAGGIAYQLFFALIPLLALVVGVLASIYGPDRAERQLVDILRDVYPSASAQEARIARSLVEGRTISLGIGLIGTVLAAGAVFGAIDTALGRVLSGRKRSFLRGRLQGLAFVAGLALIAVLSFALSYSVPALPGLLQRAGLAPGGRVLLALLSQAVAVATGFVFFFLIYRYAPRARAGGATLRSAALVSAVLWEAAKVAFGFYTGALGAFSAYGPIAFAAGLLTWIYLTAVIILFGAEYMKVRMRPS